MKSFRLKTSLGQVAFRTALVYWILSVVWILLSDRFVAAIVKNVGVLSEIQTYKGWAFVTATAIVLYYLVRIQLRKWDEEVSERKRVEDALIESEVKYRSLFENSIDAILLTAPDGEIIAANPEACKIFGRTEEELKRLGRGGVTDPDDPRVRAAIEERAQTGRFKGEMTLVRSDGTKFPAEVSSAILRESSGELRTSMVIRDVTARNRADELLRQKEEYLQALIENSSDAIAVLNANLENIYRSASRKRVLGYDETEPIGALDTVHPDDYPVARRELSKLLQTPGGTTRIEMRLRHKDGSWRNIEAVGVNLLANPAINGIVINYRDVSERRDAEKEIRLWVAALQSAANAIVITDRNGNIQFVNGAFTQLTGYEPGEAIGRNPRVLKSGKQPVSFYKEMWDAILKGNVWRGQLTNKRKDGSFYEEEMTITPVIDSTSQITHFVAIKNDITEVKKLQEQLAQSQKMESIGILAAGIAHDFNNVLGIILGHSSLIERIKDINPRVDKSAKAITQAADRGASLVRQMLTFARKSEVSFSLVSLNDSVRELQKLFYETFPRTITLICQLDEHLPLVNADTTQIHQVLLNLSVNARDAMHGSGALVIATDTADGNEVGAKFNGAPAGTYVVLTVSDNGEGMDRETVRHVFEPFFTTKGPGKGTGLGLSVVFGIIENHSGYIEVSSEPGRGTEFTIYLPAADTPGSKGKTDDELVERTTGGAETILVIEDEEMLKELAVSILGSNGYSILSASDGEEAVETYEKRWKEIDLVFSDYGLPKMTGSEVLKRMKTINPEVRFVAATGFLSPEEKDELVHSGAMEILLKPYKHYEVLEKIRRVLDE